MYPIDKINEWLKLEKEMGSTNPDRVVLATVSAAGVPHSRVVAIREINNDGILFFTQKGTQKVAELKQQPIASMTLWLAMQQREIIFEGLVHPLSQKENQHYWSGMPHERQLRFAAYAPTSLQPIESIQVIDDKYADLKNAYQDKEIPMSEFYCGFRLVPDSILFYTLGVERFSEVIRCTRLDEGWEQQTLSP